jgi:hypothetical protein
MAMVSRYVVIRDTSIDIPRPPSDGDPGGSDAHFQFDIDPPLPATGKRLSCSFG